MIATPAEGAARTPNRRRSRAECAIVCTATLVCLLPFLGKAVHLDDPMYLWAARQIQANPVDFYGLDVNWHGYTDTMAWSNKNPPLSSFYLALVAALFGWSELALHAGMLVPALALALGALALARRLSPQPLLAALAAVATPAVLVCSTSLMAEVSLAALWCWAVVLWIDGVEGDRAGRLTAGAALAGAAVLTKFVAVGLVPLLAAYAFARERELRRGSWRFAPALLLPIAALGLYQLYVVRVYGEGSPTDAAVYALLTRDRLAPVLVEKGIVGLAFLGGGLLSVLFYAPLLASRRAWLLALAAGVAAGALAVGWPGLDSIGVPVRPDAARSWSLLLQLLVFCGSGVLILALAGVDLWRRRDAASLLLGLWVFGLFVFAGFLNWSTNARSVLPAAPAVGVLVARALGERRKVRLYAPLLPAFAVAIAVAWADFGLANAARTAAAELGARYASREGALWFQGAWGFQWYMEAQGARRTDFRGSELAIGDVMIVPANNSNLWQPPREAVRLLAEAQYPAGRWIATLARPVGAGFHSDVWGPLPFALGPAPPEIYRVYAIERPLRLPDVVWRDLGAGATPR